MGGLKRHAARAVAGVWDELRRPEPSRDCILCYHSVRPAARSPDCTPDEFRRHLDWLVERVAVVPAAELLGSRGAGAAGTRVAITFDDGYRDNYEHVLPLLAERGLPAAFYVTSGFIDRDPVVLERLKRFRRGGDMPSLSWPQLREMAAAGMEIGCHTYSHPSLRRLSEAAAEDEMRRSKALIEDRLGAAVRGLAYPFGKPNCTYGPREVRMAERVGYAYALTTVARAVRPDDSPWEAPRMLVGRSNYERIEEQVEGRWDWVGLYNERAPVWLARLLSPRGFRAETYGGTYEEIRNGLAGDS